MFLMFGDKQFACTSLILSGKNRKKWSLVPRERLVLVLIFYQILTSGPYSVVLINHNECSAPFLLRRSVSPHELCSL